MAAHVLLFGADLSLALSDPRGDDIGVDAGKENYAAGLVDYLGALPVMESGLRPAPLILNWTALSEGSYVDSANIPQIVSTQLTLFHNGNGSAFDISTDQVKIAASFAENSNAFHATTTSFKAPLANLGLYYEVSPQNKQLQLEEVSVTTPHLSICETLEDISEDGDAAHTQFASLLVPCQAIVPKALPIARKASLTRFLEMRKERVRFVAPYVAKGNAQDKIRQGANHSNANTPRMQFDKFWDDASYEKKLGSCASRLVYGNYVQVEGENWFRTISGNSKQASECESAT